HLDAPGGGLPLSGLVVVALRLGPVDGLVLLEALRALAAAQGGQDGRGDRQAEDRLADKPASARLHQRISASMSRSGSLSSTPAWIASVAGEREAPASCTVRRAESTAIPASERRISRGVRVLRMAMVTCPR